MNPGGGSGWDEPPLDIQIPDDARELERDMLAYHRELRARRRRSRLRKLTRPFTAQGTVMPLLASILAVCLVAGAMLSVATFSPATAPGTPSHHPSATAASGLRSAPPRSSPENSAPATSAPATGTSGTGTSGAGPGRPRVRHQRVRHQRNGPAFGRGELPRPLQPVGEPGPAHDPAARRPVSPGKPPRQRPAG